jgi:hypothetical protein
MQHRYHSLMEIIFPTLEPSPPHTRRHKDYNHRRNPLISFVHLTNT